MRLHRTIGEFDHGMDRALRLYHNSDLIVGHGKEMMRLDHFEAFIHERGRIDRNLATHVPRRMAERLFNRDILKVGCLPPAKGAARSGDP